MSDRTAPFTPRSGARPAAVRWRAGAAAAVVLVAGGAATYGVHVHTGDHRPAAVSAGLLLQQPRDGGRRPHTARVAAMAVAEAQGQRDTGDAGSGGSLSQVPSGGAGGTGA